LLLPAGDDRQLAAESDVVAVCVQLTAETRGMIDDGFLRAMKRDAVIVNVARGEVVDEDALVAALRRSGIRGALLDVYEGELHGVPPRPELVERPDVVL